MRADNERARRKIVFLQRKLFRLRYALAQQRTLAVPVHVVQF